MTTMFPPGIFLESHGSKLNYISKYIFDYGYLWGYLGNTQCCGSACVLICEIGLSSFLHILKETKASVLHIVETCTYGEGIGFFLPEINRALGGVATVTAHEVDVQGWLVLVDITDQVGYRRKFL